MTDNIITTINTTDPESPDLPYGGAAYGEGFCITWQMGPVKIKGVNGAQVATVLGAVLQRLEFLNAYFPCAENADSIEHLKKAIQSQLDRTNRRVTQGTEGTNEGFQEDLDTMNKRTIIWNQDTESKVDFSDKAKYIFPCESVSCDDYINKLQEALESKKREAKMLKETSIPQVHWITPKGIEFPSIKVTDNECFVFVKGSEDKHRIKVFWVVETNRLGSHSAVNYLNQVFGTNVKRFGFCFPDAKTNLCFQYLGSIHRIIFDSENEGSGKWGGMFRKDDMDDILAAINDWALDCMRTKEVRELRGEIMDLTREKETLQNQIKSLLLHTGRIAPDTILRPGKEVSK